MILKQVPHLNIKSLPSWERGLKFDELEEYEPHKKVAPFVGAWIEIQSDYYLQEKTYVAPFVGAWIEIDDLPLLDTYTASRSLRGSVD